MALGKIYGAAASRRISSGAFAGLLALFLAGCGSAQNGLSSDVPGSRQSSGSTLAGTDTAPGHSLSQVTSWALFNAEALGHAPTLDEMTRSGANLLLVDPTAVASDPKLLSKRVQDIKGTGSRRVIAIVDVAKIGTASSLWNTAWQPSKSGVLPASAPSWLRAPSSGGQTQFDVVYWDSGWRAAIGGLCAQLIAAGFDGISLTGCDAYGDAAKSRATAVGDMASLVKAIADAARAKSGNASVVVDDPYFAGKLADKERKEFLDTVDGVTATGVFYGDPKSGDRSLNPNADLIAALDTLDRAGKKVLVWEQISGSDRVADFDARSRTRGYLPFVARPLDTTHTAKDGTAQTASAGSNQAPCRNYLAANFAPG